MKCLLATHNKGKLEEIQTFLGDLDIQLISLDGLGPWPPAVEDAPNFAGNARAKALYYHEKSALPTLADDSGLVVDALEGRPGVHSARYAATDAARIERLLRELDDCGAEDAASRTARFVCALSLVVSKGNMIEVEGSVEGRIAMRPKGERGFGYDPVFYYPPLAKTFSEMSPEEKNRVSHRGQALEALRLRLRGES